jgi:hypothetical protein
MLKAGFSASACRRCPHVWFYEYGEPADVPDGENFAIFCEANNAGGELRGLRTESLVARLGRAKSDSQSRSGPSGRTMPAFAKTVNLWTRMEARRVESRSPPITTRIC